MASLIVYEINSRAAHQAAGIATQLASKGKLKAKNAVAEPGQGFGSNHLGYIVGDAWVYERLIPAGARPWREFTQTTAVRPDGTPDEEVAAGREEFFANSHYLVFRRKLPSEVGDQADMIHLSMRTVENDARHDWREMQRVKNALAGPEFDAVELYPAVSRVVDNANQFHLWCYPFILPIGFPASLVSDHGVVENMGGAQRPLSASDSHTPTDPADLPEEMFR